MPKLFVVGFPRETDEISLLETFSVHCTVGTLTIIRDQETHESKGYGFITVLDPAGAERAIRALNGADLKGRTMSVRYAETQQPQAPQPLRPLNTNKTKRPRR